MLLMKFSDYMRQQNNAADLQEQEYKYVQVHNLVKGTYPLFCNPDDCIPKNYTIETEERDMLPPKVFNDVYEFIIDELLGKNENLEIFSIREYLQLLIQCSEDYLESHSVDDLDPEEREEVDDNNIFTERIEEARKSLKNGCRFVVYDSESEQVAYLNCKNLQDIVEEINTNKSAQDIFNIYHVTVEETEPEQTVSLSM